MTSKATTSTFSTATLDTLIGPATPPLQSRNPALHRKCGVNKFNAQLDAQLDVQLINSTDNTSDTQLLRQSRERGKREEREGNNEDSSDSDERIVGDDVSLLGLAWMRGFRGLLPPV